VLFSVTQTDKIHTSPFMKLEAQLRKKANDKINMEKQMNSIRTELFRDVKELQSTMSTNMAKLNEKLQTMEKYM
jgi:hypothetical protein